jgi:hypothetical protein
VLVNDRINGVAYVALSERAHPRLAQQWADAMGYRELVTFHSTDAGGHPVYHTNVMMAIGTDVAIVCAESVEDEKERNHLLVRAHHRPYFHCFTFSSQNSAQSAPCASDNHGCPPYWSIKITLIFRANSDIYDGG